MWRSSCLNLERLGILSRQRRKNFDKSKKKQRKTEEELQRVKESCEKFKNKEQQAVAKIAELESATLVLSSENSRLKKEFYSKDEQIEELTDAVESKRKSTF